MVFDAGKKLVLLGKVAIWKISIQHIVKVDFHRFLNYGLHFTIECQSMQNLIACDMISNIKKKHHGSYRKQKAMASHRGHSKYRVCVIGARAPYYFT